MAERYSLLICDDEPGTRAGLRDSVDWAALGIVVLGTAANGEEALDLVSQCSPDIILSDVRMPFMDGLEMAAVLQKMGFGGKLVFMSAYGEVEYLKAAMQVEALDYILKPVAPAELSEVMARVCRRIDADRKREDLYRQSLGMLRERFLLRLATGGAGEIADLSGQLAELELGLDAAEDIMAILVSADAAEAADGGWEQVWQTAEACRHFFGDGDRVVFASLANGDLVGLLPMADIPGRDSAALAESLRERLGIGMRGSMTIACGPVVRGLGEFRRSAEQARLNLSRRSYLGDDQVIPADYAEHTDPVRQLDESGLATLADTLRLAELPAIDAAVRALLPIGGDAPEPAALRAMTLRILLVFNQVAGELDLPEGDHLLAERQLAVVANLGRATQAQAHVLGEARWFCEAFRQRTVTHSRQVIEKVKLLLRQHCKDGITVKELAAEVFLTHTYLCMLFKQETGETIKDYQTRIRVERAKELLADFRLKTYEICFEVGYTDPGYFARTFKRLTGMNPTEFRDSRTAQR